MITPGAVGLQTDGTEPGNLFVVLQFPLEMLAGIFPNSYDPVGDTGLVAGGQEPGAGTLLVVPESKCGSARKTNVVLRMVQLALQVNQIHRSHCPARL
jgi:hypothetical protein